MANVLDWKCSMVDRNEKDIKSYSENLKGRDQGVHRRILLKWILKE
jgi:hypothetical protein